MFSVLGGTFPYTHGNHTDRDVGQRGSPLKTEDPKGTILAPLLKASSDSIGRTAGIVAVAIALGFSAFAFTTDGHRQIQDFPLPGPPPNAPSRQDFAGSQSCAPCHTSQYDAWIRSTHGAAGGTPSRQTVIAPFDGQPIHFQDAVVVPTVDSTGRYLFLVKRDGRETMALSVDGVIGRGHMEGGGTQGFVSIFPDGTIRFLPFDFSRHNMEWFCNTSPVSGWWASASVQRKDAGWLPVTRDLRLAECGDWPPARILGTNFRFANCQQCHGSQIAFSFDSASAGYRTELTSLTINCESCHGPKATHVELAGRDQLTASQIDQPTALDLMDEDSSLSLCFACHALKRGFREDFMPGAPLEDFYSLRGILFSDDPWLPDGRIKTFGYQQNHVASSCYLDGTMTCVDCHDPHSQAYRDIYGRELPGRFDDGQCLDCHASKADDPTRHTKHPIESEGSRCVNCHMPYLQHPEVGAAVRYARSDHTIAIPRPAFDDALGITNACSLCHQEVPIDTLASQTERWYGSIKPHRPIVSALFELTDNLEAPPNLSALLDSEANHPMAQVAAIKTITTRYLDPNMAELLPEVIDRLMETALNEDLDVRATALSALHLARGNHPDVRNFLVTQLTALGDRDYAVRARWVLALRAYGDEYVRSGNIARAMTTYHKALELGIVRDLILLDLANLHASIGNTDSAISYYEEALALSPTLTPGLVNLGVAFERAGRETEAYEAYARAVRINPGEVLAHIGLGNLFFERGQYRNAADAFSNAVYFDPSLIEVQIYLAQSYLLLGMADSALTAVRAALDFDPENSVALRMLSDLVNRID